MPCKASASARPRQEPGVRGVVADDVAVVPDGPLEPCDLRLERQMLRARELVTRRGDRREEQGSKCESEDGQRSQNRPPWALGDDQREIVTASRDDWSGCFPPAITGSRVDVNAFVRLREAVMRPAPGHDREVTGSS
jgi:hypothetical protein